MMTLSLKKLKKQEKWREKRNAVVVMVASNNNGGATNVGPILASWRVGEDRVERLRAIKGA